MIRRWVLRLGLTVSILLLPECAARLFLPQHGLTFVETVAQTQNLPKNKTRDERRVFVIGASSMMGYHHFGQASLSQAIAFLLKESALQVPWRVITFAKAGEGSEFVFDTAQESLRYKPDLLLLYVGENEFAAIPVLRRSWRYRIERLFLRSKLIRVARQLAGRTPWPSVPDFRQASWQDVYGRIHKERDAIMTDFVRRGAAFLQNRPTYVSVVFLQPVLSLPPGPLLWDQLEKWDLDWTNQGTHDFIRGLLAADARRHHEAVGFLQKAAASNPESAWVMQYLSLSLAALGKTREAEAAREKALELDMAPSQLPLSYYEETLRGTKSAAVIPLASRLAARMRRNTVPDDLIEDGCHPSVELEFNEAQEILQDPQVRESIGYSGNASSVAFERYAAAQGIDASYLAKVYSNIGAYLVRDAAGDAAFKKALSFTPQDPLILEAYRNYRQTRSARLAMRRQILLNWRPSVRLEEAVSELINDE